MGFLSSFLNNDITIIRGETVTTMRAAVQGDKILLPVDADVKKGDIVRCHDFDEDHVVTNVQRNRSGKGNKLDHAEIKHMPLSEWQEQRQRQQGVHVTQNIAAAHVVAGHDVSGPVTFNITAEQLLQTIEDEVQSDTTIPEAEKKTILGRLKELFDNSYIKTLGSTVISEAVKRFIFGGPQPPQQ